MSLVRVDCHLHTVASGDAVTTLDELAERAAQAGLDVVCVTDHNETAAAIAAAGRDLGVRIVVGEEIRTSDGDVIGLFLTERIPYVLPLAEVVARIRAQGGLVYVPHPFDQGRTSLGAVLPRLCEQGDVDVAYRSLSPTDLEALKAESDKGVKVVDGAGTEIRYITFNVKKPPVDKLAVTDGVITVFGCCVR